MTYSIKQPTGRFLYGSIVAPIAAAFLIFLFIYVVISLDVIFVYGAIGGICCITATIFMIKAAVINIRDFRMVTASNPIPITIDNGVINAYEITKLDNFNYNKPIVIDLKTSEIKEITGGIIQKIKVKNDEHSISFESSMRFVNGSYDELVQELLSQNQ